MHGPGQLTQGPGPLESVGVLCFLCRADAGGSFCLVDVCFPDWRFSQF